MKVILLCVSVILVIGGLAVAQFRSQARKQEAALQHEVEALLRKKAKLESEKSELEETIAERSADWEKISVKVEELQSVEAQVDQYIQLLPPLLREFNKKQFLADGYQKAFTFTSDLRPGQEFESLKLGNGESYGKVKIKEIKGAPRFFQPFGGVGKSTHPIVPG